MKIKLASGKEMILEDVVRDPKAEAIDWLRKYKARRQAVPGPTKGEEDGKRTGDG